jgi:hypothetical protein
MPSDQISIRLDVAQAIVGHLDDYIYHKTGCLMNYTRSSANYVKELVEKAISEATSLEEK